jgi:arginine:ornithine antiporter / lysine permease
LMISVGGAFLSWTLLCAEIPFTCGRDGTFPKWFGAENKNGSPANALWATNILIQLFLILSFFSKNAYQFFYFIASVAILPPYVLSGAYALKLALRGEGYRASESRTWDILVGALATIYGLWLVYAAGLNFLLMCTVLFAPGILVYMQARRERGETAFAGFDLVLAILIALLAVVAAYLMWTGVISPL